MGFWWDYSKVLTPASVSEKDLDNFKKWILEQEEVHHNFIREPIAVSSEVYLKLVKLLGINK